MKQEQLTQLEALFGYLPVGIAVLDGPDLRICYLNSYIRALLDEQQSFYTGIEQRIEELLPEKLHKNVLACLQRVVETGISCTYNELPYEGFLQTRGRTYWCITIKKNSELPNLPNALFVTIEDVTEKVRVRLHLQAIQHISSAIVGAYTLSTVFDRILRYATELIDTSYGAVFLIDHTISDYDKIRNALSPVRRRVTIAAQKGIHAISQNWHPILNNRILLAKVGQQPYPVTIVDSRQATEIDLPLLDDSGTPRHPGSVLCVPIFEPYSARDNGIAFQEVPKEITRHGILFGSIEIYHPQSRSFSQEDVELLEQFAQQAGLAIQNARLFRKLDAMARAERRSAHQQKYVMQAIPDGVIIFDPRWRVAETNQAIRTLLGWNDTIIGLPITQAFKQSKAIFPDDVTRLVDSIPELERRAQAGVTDEFKMIGADGQKYTIRCTYTPIRDDIGDTFAFVVIYRDGTAQAADRERIEAEVVARTRELAQRNEALQLAKLAQETEHARLELLLERLPSGVMLVSAQDNSIIIINRRAVQLLQRIGVLLEAPNEHGEAVVDATGANIERLLRPIAIYAASGSSLSYEEQPLHLALKHGKASEAELHMQDVDDETMYIFVSAAPLRNVDGIISSAVLVCHEITTIKALERAREDFFTTMAHELKTPLANIRAQLSALLAKDLQWSPAEQYASLEVADEQVQRLVSTVNRLLEASRIEAGALRLRLEAVLLPELFEDLAERLEALIASSRRHLRIEYTQALPAVRADYDLIMSVLINLLSNAFRYAPEDDIVLLEAHADFAPQDVSQEHPIGVTLCVSDRGPGIPQEQQKLLFRRFSTLAAMNRIDSAHAERPRQGEWGHWSSTGLGLYISRGIVEAHNSTFTLTSSPGKGASFAFTLPIFKETTHC